METRREFQKIRAERARARRQKKQHRIGMICVSFIVGLLLITMSVQILDLKQKEKAFEAQEQELRSRLKSEQERKEEIRLYEQHVKTKEYVEEVAKSKLGLVYPYEIIFREQK